MPTCKRCGTTLPADAVADGALKCGSCGATYNVFLAAAAGERPFDDDDLFGPPPPPRPKPEDEILKRPAPDVDPLRLLEHRLRAERKELPVPRWTFFSGVFTFPFYPSVLSRWLALSGALLAFFLFAGLIWGTVRGGGFEVVIAGFFINGGVVLFFVIFGYAAKLFWAVINGTGDGLDEIVDWGEASWKEWMWPLLWVGYVLFVSLAAGFGLRWLLMTPSHQPVVAVLWLIFPVFLLSTIDSNHPFGVISGPIVRSWRVCWWGWLVFYALSGLLIDGYYWAARLAGSSPLAMLVVAGPLLAAVVLIYARLIGRLAWAAGMSGAWDRPDDEDEEATAS